MTSLSHTPGWFGRATKQAAAGLSFRNALAQDLWDIRHIGEAQYGDPGYYNQGIKDCPRTTAASACSRRL